MKSQNAKTLTATVLNIFILLVVLAAFYHLVFEEDYLKFFVNMELAICAQTIVIELKIMQKS